MRKIILGSALVVGMVLAGCGRNEVRLELEGLNGRKVRVWVKSKVAVDTNVVVSGGMVFQNVEDGEWVAKVVTNNFLREERLIVKPKPFRGVRSYKFSFRIPPEPKFVPKGTIAFATNRDGDKNWEIYEVKVDGTGLRNLSRCPEGSDIEPAWSPDGRKIAFVSDRNGFLNQDIYVMDADGSNQVRLTYDEAKDYDPAWSPDGKKIAFVSERTGKAQIYIMNADGTGLRCISDGTASDRSPAWSPDGKKIAFVSDRYSTPQQGNDDIFVMNSDGTHIVRLTEDPEYDFAPQWSPDGKYILFTSSRYGGQEIFIMKADGSCKMRLTVTEDIYEWTPVWSPDGLGIAFAKGKGDDYDICIMDRGGREVRKVLDDPYEDRDPSWRPY